MSADLDTLIRQYGERLDNRAPTIGELAARARAPHKPLKRPRPRWTVAVAAAAVVLLVIGGGVALGILFGGGSGDMITPDESIPESWTTYTAEIDGIVSECLCEMALAPDGSIWMVGWDGISRFDGTQWERIQPPRPFTGEGWPAVAPAPDGSVWILGMSYIAQYVNGTWISVVEAGFQDDGGALAFQGLEIDDDGLVWTNLADVDGVIQDGTFIPRGWPEKPAGGGFVPPEGLVILATAPDGSIWMGMGDSIIGVEGALVEKDGEQLTRHALGGVEDVAFEADGIGWFLVPEVGPDAWMFGREQWSDPGLYRLEDSEWYRITTVDGLAGYRVSEMVVAPDGALWLSTADGTVTRYQPGTDPQSGTPVEIENRPFTDDDLPPPAYPPITHAEG